MRRRTHLAWLGTLLPGLHVRAQVGEAGAPPELAQDLPAARLLGQQRFRVWGFEVYDARLWTLPGFAAARFEQQPLALELAYLRELKGAAIAERSLKEMRRVGNLTAELEARWLAEMQRLFPDVRRGDRLLGLQRPGEGAFFWLNGQARGELRDAQFARLFFGIWLSPQTSEPALRQALLGIPP
jgi:hypothetical protein